MANPNVFQSLIQPVRSVLDYSSDLDRQEMNQLALEGQRRQNALAALTEQQTRNQLGDSAARRNALQAVAAGWGAGTTDEQRVNSLRSNPLTFGDADALDKSIQERTKTKAAAAKDQAEADAKAIANRKALLEHGILSLQTAQTPQDAARQIQAGVQQGFWSMQDAQAKLAAIPLDQGQFEQWRQNQLRAVTEAYRQLPTIQNLDLGGSRVTQAVDPVTGKPTITGTQRVTQSPDSAANTGLGYAKLGEERRHNQQIESEGKTQVINDPTQGIMIVNKGTGLVRSGLGLDGKPITPESVAKKQNAAKNTLPILDEADSLIDQSTGSYIGAGVDAAGRAVGMSTEGAKATAKLKVLEGQLMLSQPRMEGPQSDKDAALYRQMAGQIGDPTVPRDIKKAALGEIRRLQEKWAGVQSSAPSPTPGPTRINGDADYNALPSGALFVGPDGKARRKP